MSSEPSPLARNFLDHVGQPRSYQETACDLRAAQRNRDIWETRRRLLAAYQAIRFETMEHAGNPECQTRGRECVKLSGPGCQVFEKMVAADGFEPPTKGL